MTEKFYTSERSVQIVVSLLKAHGIRKIVTSANTLDPTFLKYTKSDSWFQFYSSIDERSASYIACGIATESQEPVVLACTGASAFRNYYSALTEAYYRKLPLLTISFHNGIDKVGHLFNNTADYHLYPKDAIKKSINVPLIKNQAVENYHVIELNKALLELFRHGCAPVHIHLHTSIDQTSEYKEISPVRVLRRFTPFETLPQSPQGKIAVFIGSHTKFSEEQIQAVDGFCGTYDAVVLADQTSGYHGKYQVLPSFFANRKDEFVFDLLIHIGEVSIATKGIYAKEVWRVSEDGEVRDTFGTLSSVFEMPETIFFKLYTVNGKDLHANYDTYQSAYDEIQKSFQDQPFNQSWVAQQLSKSLPDGCTLHLGVSDVLQNWNQFFLSKKIDVKSNVGGYGVDGQISALVGASLYSTSRIYFGVFTTSALIYDLNVIGNRHVGNNIRLLFVNSRLDSKNTIASSDLVRQYAENLGYEYLQATNKEEFKHAISRFAISEMTSKPMFFEVLLAD